MTTSRLPGEEGLWSFIAADMVLFALLFGSFLSQWAEEPVLFAQSQGKLGLTFAIVNTLFLLTSSLFAALAVQAERVGETRRSRLYVFLTLGLGLAFVTTKLTEYHHEIGAGIMPTTNAFFMFYFVVTGMHLTHVIGGMGLLALVASRLNGQVAPERRQYLLESGASFWHMVDLLWLVILPIFYLLN